MQLNLTDYEAQLLEQRLRGRTVSFSDADYLMLTGIADRLLAGEVDGRVGRPWEQLTADEMTACLDTLSWTPVDYPDDLPTRTIGIMPSIGQPPLQMYYENGPIRPVLNHTTRRETDEYACSCGARWSYDDVDGHP